MWFEIQFLSISSLRKFYPWVCRDENQLREEFFKVLYLPSWGFLSSTTWKICRSLNFFHCLQESEYAMSVSECCHVIENEWWWHKCTITVFLLRIIQKRPNLDPKVRPNQAELSRNDTWRIRNNAVFMFLDFLNFKITSR